MSHYELSEGCSVVWETPDDGYSYFFGYYDKSPVSPDGRFILAHRVSFDGRDFTADDFAEVGFFNLLGDQCFHSLGHTSAINWQQGSQLQWLTIQNSLHVVFNDRLGEKFVSVLINLDTREKKIFDLPIYSIRPDGREAICINYERLFYCRKGYHYEGVENPRWDQPICDGDGLFALNLVSGESKMVIGIEQLLSRFGCRDRSLPHWFEHVSWAPDGSQFMFLLRSGNHENDTWTQLFTADQDGSNLYMYPDFGFYSHYTWKSNSEISIWTIPAKFERSKTKIQLKSLFNRLIKWWPAINKIKSIIRQINPKPDPFKFVTFKTRSDFYVVESAPFLSRNGHTSYCAKQRFYLNDTYQDEANFRWLYIHWPEQNRTATLGKFFSTYNDTGFRCDLHPRWSESIESVVIDVAVSNMRTIKVLSYDFT